MRPESGERCVSCGRVPHSVNLWHYCTPRSNINTRILPHSTVLHEISRWPMSSQVIHVALRKRQHLGGSKHWYSAEQLLKAPSHLIAGHAQRTPERLLLSPLR
jgi:hypothetical protein